MAKINSNFISGFLDSFAKTSQVKQEQKIKADERKLQTKLFEKQLEALDLKKSADKQIGFMQRGVGEEGPAQPKSLMDILSDPRGQQLLMQSGMNPKDIISMQNQPKAFDPTQIPPGMVLSGVKITPDGQPMYDYSIPKVDELRDKAAVEREVVEGKKTEKAKEMVGIINQANKLLDDSASGYLETGLSLGKKAVNFSDKTTQADQKLKLLSGWLVANVPRMEGPQSEFDVKNYQEMAGKIADSTVPIKDRKAALGTLLELQSKYAGVAPQGNKKVVKFSDLPEDE